MNYAKHYRTRNTSTPQSEPIPGSTQVPNNAGGFAWRADAWQRLDRFLILGTEGGTYYVGEKKLTQDNAQNVQACLDNDGLRVVRRIVEVSDQGLAAKNDPAIFALAMAASSKQVAVRQAALAALPKVCRIGTHLFHFAEYVKAFRGYGRSLASAIRSWYNDRSLHHTALQAVKYQSRDGWSHRDMLRLSHPKTTDPARNALYRYIVKGEWNSDHADALPLVDAFEKAKKIKTPAAMAKLIREAGLPRECVPTQLLNSSEVWEALLEDMPMTAMIRNLGNMSKCGLLVSGSDAATKVASALNNKEALVKSRLHPIAILSALVTYQSGRGVRGSGTWTPVSKVVDALDNAFYASFQNVEPTNLRWCLAVDVSGSMSCSALGLENLNCRTIAACLAMVTARTEPNYTTVIFENKLNEVEVSPRKRLDDVVKQFHSYDFGGTDCSLPMIWAKKNKRPFDVFAVYTDSETWAGTECHPSEALAQYRHAMGIQSRSVVLGIASNDFTIADPNDPLMLDLCGMSTDTPKVMSLFASGKI